MELPKFKKEEHELTTSIDRWAYFFKHTQDTSESEIDEIMKGFSLITKSYHKANQVIENIADLLLYEQIENEERVQKAQLEQSFADGMEKGREERIEKGVQKERRKMLQSLLEQGFVHLNILKIMKISEDEDQNLFRS